MSEADFSVEFNPEEEIVITEGGLMTITEGIAQLGIVINEVSDKLSEEEYRKLMIPVLATFVATARLFSRERKAQIFNELEKAIGINLAEFL